METEIKPQDLSSIASNTPEQSQGDVNLLEQRETCSDDEITRKEKTLGSITNEFNLNIKDEKVETMSENLNKTVDNKSPIKDETDDISQPMLSIDNSVLLSPPKSEPQTLVISPTDENTATSSPPSESQLSPAAATTSSSIESNSGKSIETSKSTRTQKLRSSTTSSSSSTRRGTERSRSKANEKEKDANKETSERYINLVANGTIPKSGKPLTAAALSKKLNKSRGRPKRRNMVPIYQSEISDNKIGIKLCIKKSSDPTILTKSKSSRKRSRKSKHREYELESDDSEPEKRRRTERANNNTDKHKKSTSTDQKKPVEQSVWGSCIPENVLYDIFNYVVDTEGCLPTLFRLGLVCTLWRKVSLSSSLWSNLDWGIWIKDKYRTEVNLKWLIENRMRGCKELNIANWKVSDIKCVLYRLAENCPDLIGITLSGWKGFHSDHLTFLVEEFKKLERIDLSAINVEMNSNKGAVALQTLCNSIQTIDGRLTHLHLAHNRLAGIPQIVTTLSTFCPNLILLDLSNVRTVAVSHGILHVEKLQQGCQKLKILRITNSHITLNPIQANQVDQVESPGFPELEELSVASLADESRLINDEFLQRILKTSTKLKLLDVRGCARLTHDSLIRLPAWDLKHLFLSGCSITRDVGSGLELIASKWAHSLIEFELSWASVQEPLDNALRALADKGAESPLANLNLCGSSVSEEAVKEVLAKCPLLYSINLSSCRGLPRGVKRLITGAQLKELRDVLKVTLKTSPKSENTEPTN